MILTIDGKQVEGSATELAEFFQALSERETHGAAPRRGPGRPSKGQNGAAAPQAAKPGKPVSAKQAEARKLQGAYLGVVRQLSKRDKAEAKKILAEKGKQAAIDWARSRSK